MEAGNVLSNGHNVNLQETFEDMDEDNERLLEEDILITNEEIGRDNIIHVIDEGKGENQENINLGDEDSSLVGNANDYWKTLLFNDLFI